ncbi:hypothetical protein SAMN02745126_00616 [Enhydrobacter aerosaccus]|uniref:DUF5681 domain-containing protein n=1 Tax=Enhydrobacter aerosaccus TaxID=225324 RepID=A0A1T4K023_9HYPH|nr:DUF5681 domain-containing protein [Enhydrobacter aerosaccus]SJZ35826.1 hypothetical protein SAMN02745126_00616 [Enhydrobacter aerosaccus]
MSKFKKGHPGGPGRPRGGRNAANRLLDQLAAEGAEAVVRKMIETALAGDVRAAEMLLKRAWTQPRGRTVEFDLPPVTEAADLVPAHAAVVAAVGAGTLTPEEGSSLTTILEAQRRAIEVVALEQRVQALEAEMARPPQ